MASYGAQARWPMEFEVEAVPDVSSVAAIANTRDGFVWVGSPRGVCRWDGASLRCLDGTDGLAEAFDTGAVNALATTRDGTLWVGGDNGLFRRKSGDEFERQIYGATSPASLPRDKIVALRSAGNELWLASLQGLHHLNGGVWRHLGWPNPAFGLSVEALDARSDGSVRVLAKGEIWTASGQGSELVQQALSVVATDVRPAGPSPPRAAWVGELAAGWPQDAPQVFSGLLDRNGRVWMATYDGVYTRDSAMTPPGKRIANLPSTAFMDLLEDPQGNVWTIGFGSSLFRISSPRHTTILANDGKGGDAAFAVARAGDGKVYATTEQGLSIYAQGAHRRIAPSMGLPSYSIRSLAIDGRNHVWITTLKDGLVKWDGTIFTQFGRSTGFPTNEWKAIGAHGASVWAAANDGSAIRIDAVDAKWEPIRGLDRKCSAGDVCPQRVRAIGVAPRGDRVWFCTEGKGLLVMDASMANPPSVVAGLPEIGVNYVNEDERGVAWVATEQGLFRVEGKDVTAFGPATGMPQLPLMQIADARLASGKHELWIGTRAGILRVPRDDLDEVADGRREPISVRRYGVADGVATDQIIGAFHPASLFDPQGLVWFASVRGLVLFDSQFSQPHPQSITIESVVSHGRVFSAIGWRDEHLALTAGTRDVEISYVAPAYMEPKRIHYRYRLAGLDTAWTSAGARRTAYYTQLKPGHYQFIVEARADDGNGPVPRQSLSVTIAPYFYQTRTFAVLLVACALALAAAAMTLRTRQIAARFNAVAEERARIARDFHDTLGQVFAASGLQLDSLQRAAPPDPALISRIRQVKQTLSHGKLAARRALWSVRRTGGAAGPRGPFTKTLQDLGSLYEEVSLVVTSEGQERELPGAAEDEILRIAEEAVSNAVAHGRAQRVSIELQYQPEAFSLWVRDDGAGFDPSSSRVSTAGNLEASGLGLVGMEERARVIGARLHVHSEPGVGSEIGVVLPVCGRRP